MGNQNQGSEDFLNASTPAPAPAPTAIPGTDQSVLASLVQLLLLREGREVEKQEGERKQREARQRQHDANARDTDSKYLLKQARCKHLKGGRKGPKTANKDYAVYMHTYINAVSIVRCQLCGMRWHAEDTVDYLVRGKKKISNHTKIGWREAQAMLEQSTNTVTSSEIPGRILTGGVDTGGLTTDRATGRIVAVTPTDEHGNAVADVQM